MRHKKLIFYLFLLLIEAVLITIVYSLPTGRAFGGTPAGDIVPGVLIGVFIITLFALLMSFRYYRDAQAVHPDEITAHKTQISREYAVESLSHKLSKHQILLNLKKKGFKEAEITTFLDKWNKHNHF